MLQLDGHIKTIKNEDNTKLKYTLKFSNNSIHAKNSIKLLITLKHLLIFTVFIDSITSVLNDNITHDYCFSIRTCSECNSNYFFQIKNCYWSSIKNSCLTILSENEYKDIINKDEEQEKYYINEDIVNSEYYFYTSFWNYLSKCKYSSTSINYCNNNNSYIAPITINIEDDSNQTNTVISNSSSGDNKDNQVNALQKLNFQYCYWKVYIYSDTSVNNIVNKVSISFKTENIGLGNFKIIGYYYTTNENKNNTSLLNQQSYSISNSNVELTLLNALYIEVFYYYSGIYYSNTINYSVEIKVTIFNDTDSTNTSSSSSVKSNDDSDNSQTSIDIVMIIIPVVSSLICFIACMGLLCTCSKRIRTSVEEDQRESTLRQLRQLNQIIDFSRLRNLESIRNAENNDPESLIPNQDAGTRNKLIYNEMLLNELKGEKYLEKLNNFKSDCTICLEAFVENSIVIVLKCKHIFHKECLKEWIVKDIVKSKCPNCNFNILHQTYDEVQVENEIIDIQDNNNNMDIRRLFDHEFIYNQSENNPGRRYVINSNALFSRFLARNLNSTTQRRNEDVLNLRDNSDSVYSDFDFPNSNNNHRVRENQNFNNDVISSISNNDTFVNLYNRRNDVSNNNLLSRFRVVPTGTISRFTLNRNGNIINEINNNSNNNNHENNSTNIIRQMMLRAFERRQNQN